jgi:TolB protein
VPGLILPPGSQQHSRNNRQPNDGRSDDAKALRKEIGSLLGDAFGQPPGRVSLFGYIAGLGSIVFFINRDLEAYVLLAVAWLCSISALWCGHIAFAKKPADVLTQRDFRVPKYSSLGGPATLCGIILAPSAFLFAFWGFTLLNDGCNGCPVPTQTGTATVTIVAPTDTRIPTHVTREPTQEFTLTPVATRTVDNAPSPSPTATSTAPPTETSTPTLTPTSTNTPTPLGNAMGLFFISDQNSGESGDADIYHLDLRSQDVGRITGRPGRDEYPAWSPKAQQMVFVQHSARAVRYVRIAHDGTHHTVGLDVLEADRATWSPEGDRFAVSAVLSGTVAYNIYIIDLGQGPRVALKKPNECRDAKGPAWSLDGNYIAFHCVRYAPHESDIYLWRLADNDIKALTRFGGREEYPAWSPDSRQIAFTSNQSGYFNLWLMEADGTNVQQLTHSEAQHWLAAWSPDGGVIAFQSNEGPNWEIHVVAPTLGATPIPLTDNSVSDEHPVWRPQ